MIMVRITCVLPAAALCALVGLASSPVRAEFLSDFTGNTLMADQATAKGVVSFSVFHNAGDNWVTAINTALGLTGSNALSASTLTGGGNPLDLKAKYVYLYQVVNTVSGTSGTPIETLRLQVNRNLQLSSAGYFAGKVFVDGGGKVGARGVNGNLSDRGLGQDPIIADVLDGIPSYRNQTLDSIKTLQATGQPAAIDPTAVDLFPVNMNLQYVTFTMPGLLNQASSSIFFITADQAPTYAQGDMENQNYVSSQGDIPSVVNPEPASLVMAAFGLAGFGFAFMRRRRAKAA
jgi:MYXO-CTERM domain-containing protein